jgi:transcriptional regulator with GAF, ATPase, and Fis domain
MENPNPRTIGCLARASDLETLLGIVHQTNVWRPQPISIESAQTLDPADLYISLSVPTRHAVRLLGGRTAPWFAFGAPTFELQPDLWLPAVPDPALLATLIRGFLKEPSRPTVWRRKSDMIIGRSAPIRQLLQTLDQLASVQTPVVITGESGVGKDLVAQALHYCGSRAQGPFIAINCAAIPETLFEAELFGYTRGAFTGATHARAGAFEAANNGTLFLDELGEIPITMQAKLLRVLQTNEVQRIGATEPKKVSFRLVTATNRDLEAAVKAGRFREDLFYRVQVYPIRVVPLRERIDDVPALVSHHLSVIATRENRPPAQLTSAALEKLLAYSWPGNVRELVNTLERSVLLAGSDAVDADHIVFPDHGFQTTSASALAPYRDAKARFERDYYTQLLRAADGNVSLAAKLGCKTRKEVYDALKRLELDPARYRTGTQQPFTVAAAQRGRARRTSRRE